MTRALLAFAAIILSSPSVAQSVIDGRICVDTPGPVISRKFTASSPNILGVASMRAFESGHHRRSPTRRAIRLALDGIKANSVAGHILTHAQMGTHNIPGEWEMITPVPFKVARLTEAASRLLFLLSRSLS